MEAQTEAVRKVELLVNGARMGQSGLVQRHYYGR